MDKLQPLITFLKKQYFWLLAGLLLIVGVFGMWTATGAVAQQFDDFQQEIKSKKGNLTTIQGTNPHANQDVIDRQLAENQKLAENRREVWETLYNRQREEVLKWPPVKTAFDKMIVGKEFGDVLERRYLRDYQNFVKERFEELHQIVRAQDPNQGTNRRRINMEEEPEGRMYSPSTDTSSVVDWQDQHVLRAKFVWNELPSHVRVWVTQEDLWIYETLLNIVARVNQDATIRENAAIQAIITLQVGQEAAAGSNTTGRLYRPEGDEGLDGGDDFGSSDDGGSSAGAAAPGEEELVDAELLVNRYLDREGNAIANWQEAGPEYKRIPVRMTVRIDQRRIIDFLVACANQPLTVEVDQVRINVDQQESTTGFGRPNMLEEMEFAEEGGEIEFSGDRVGKSSGPDNQMSPEERRYVELTVQGVVYVFNPVDLGRLHLADDEAADGDDLVGNL